MAIYRYKKPKNTLFAKTNIDCHADFTKSARNDEKSPKTPPPKSNHFILPPLFA
ncbi:hypothetical protein [Helicobacter sp. T3_23-1056]